MRFIKLTQGKYATVDDEDFEWLNSFKWYAAKSGRSWYVVRESCAGGKSQTLKMHRLLIFGCPEVDHKNSNGLDNRKENLRAASKHENQRNQRKQIRPTGSRYKGVTWYKRGRSWGARIGNGKRGNRLWLGAFRTQTEAARAYDVAAKKLYGDFARPNFSQCR